MHLKRTLNIQNHLVYVGLLWSIYFVHHFFSQINNTNFRHEAHVPYHQGSGYLWQLFHTKRTVKLAVCLSVEIGIIKVPFTHTFLLHNEYNIKKPKYRKTFTSLILSLSIQKNLAKTVKLCTIIFYPSSRYLKQPENKFVKSPRKKIHQGFFFGWIIQKLL